MDAAAKGPKACTTCAKAKARCIPGGHGDKCERCQRLKKECFSRPPAPPRIKKRPKRSRVAELEKRLNELSSQVENAQPRNEGSPETGSNDPAISLTEKSLLKAEPLNFGHLFPTAEDSEDKADEAVSSSSWDTKAFPKLDSLWPMPDEAALLLADYHATYAHLFPFVVISGELTSEQLRDRRPYVWKASMMVACFFDATRQVRLGEELLNEITRAAMMDGVKSLDLLQALQLLIGWFHYALKGAQLTNLLFLTRSMTVNLGSAATEPLPSSAKYSELDNARAHAGTYYLNTLVFTTNKKTDIFMNTVQLEASCKAIEAANEYPSDVLLISFIKISVLTQNISLAMTFNPAKPRSQVPLLQVVQSFQQQLDAFKTTLPEQIKSNDSVLAHIATAEILLKDVSLSEQYCTASDLPLTDRLQLLWSLVRSLHGFYEVRYIGRNIEKPRFLNLSVSDIAFSLITGIRLLSVKLPGWELAQAHKELGLDAVLGWMIQDLGKVVLLRRTGRRMSGTPAPIAEDPLSRLWRLLHNARELVQLQLQRGQQSYDTEGEMAPYMIGDFDESLWFDLVAEVTWAMNDDSMPIDVM